MIIEGRGRREDAWLIEAVHRGEAYPFPGNSVIPPVVIPSPPHVNSEVPDVERASFIAKSYRTAFHARSGRVSFAMTRGSIADYRYYKCLLTASQLLAKFKVSPLMWAYWSMGIWEDWKGRGKPAPVHWIFSAARIDTRVQEYHRYSGDGPPKAQLTFMHRALIRRYNKFISDAKSMGCLKATQIHFPGGTYEALVQKARAAQKSKQREVDAKVKNGEWVW